MSEEGIKLDKRGLILILGLVAIFLWFNQTSAPTPVTEASPQTLLISKLSLAVPIIYIDSTDENLIQRGLERGVVHLAGTARPGEVGNCYIMGHSSDYPNRPGSYKNVFAYLTIMKIGDEIQIG